MWTVGELREKLDDYGDHVPVKVVAEKGNGTWIRDFDVKDQTDHTEGVIVTLEVDLN